MDAYNPRKQNCGRVKRNRALVDLTGTWSRKGEGWIA